MTPIRTIISVGLLSLGAAVPASAAESPVFSWSGCGGASFSSCATVNAYYDPATRYLRFTVSNDNGAGWPGVFSQLGWSGFNVGFDAATFQHLSGSGNWSYDATLGSIIDYAGAAADSPAPANGLGAGESAEFRIKFSGSTAVSFTRFAFALHELGLADYWAQLGVACSESNKLGIESYNGSYTAGAPNKPNRNNSALAVETELSEDCQYRVGSNSDVVPEPLTSLMLATGLVVLAGATAFQRRRAGK